MAFGLFSVSEFSSLCTILSGQVEENLLKVNIFEGALASKKQNKVLFLRDFILLLKK